MSFTVGQQILCIDDRRNGKKMSGLRSGEIYIVEEVLDLTGLIRVENLAMFVVPERFRSLGDKSIEWAREMIRQSNIFWAQARMGLHGPIVFNDPDPDAS